MTWIVAAGLLAAFVAIEERLRQGAEARSREAGAKDRGTTRLVGAAFGVSVVGVVASPILNATGLALIPVVVGWIGVALMVAGLALRVWASRALGASYTRTLRTHEHQELVRAGPYRVVRHPGYAGTLAMLLGAGLATGNWLIATVITAASVAAYVARMHAEEAMLSAAFADEYRDHERRTWRLLPPIY